MTETIKDVKDDSKDKKEFVINFCDKCDNLYDYVSYTDENDDSKKIIKLKCQACGNETNIKPNTQIYAKQYVSRIQDMQIDPDLQYDHTLTRTSLVPCQNSECPTYLDNGPQPEVVTYQYNSESGKLGYVCAICHRYWMNL